MNVQEQQARADYMDALYEDSGRTDGLYTGLYAERVQQLVMIDRIERLHCATCETGTR
jgi:hypothetical protein